MSPPRKRSSSSASVDAAAGRSKKKRVNSNSSQQRHSSSQYAPGQVSNMLIRVVDANNITQLRKLLKKRDSSSVSGLAVTDHEIHICLPRAASAGLVDCCRLLFQRLTNHGQEKYTRHACTRGFGVLHEAALMGHISVLQLLVVTFSFNVNQLNEIHSTPLCTALPCLETTRFLLLHGANPNLPNQGGGSNDGMKLISSWPLYWAVRNDRSSVDLVRLLLEFGADANFNFTSLQQLQEYNAQHQHLDEQQQHDRDSCCALIVNVAIRKGQIKMVDLLLQYGAFVGYDYAAATLGSSDVNDASAPSFAQTAETALNEYSLQPNVSRHQKLAMCRTLVKHAKRRQRAPCQASGSGSVFNADIMAFLHASLAQIMMTATATTMTTTDDDTCTADHVQLFLEAGVDAVRAMHYCIQQNNITACRYLLELGVVVDPFQAQAHQNYDDDDRNGMAASPFHEAARLEDTTILKELFLKHWDERFLTGEKNGGKNDSGDYPLHVLCCDEQVSLAAITVVVQHCQEYYPGHGGGGGAAVLQATDGQEGFFPIHLAANWDVSLNVLYYLLRQCPTALLLPAASSLTAPR